MTTEFFGKNGMIWWKGVVEDRKDPLMMGRVRTRIFGWHTKDKTQMPTEELPWAIPSQSLDHGNNVTGVKEGDWVWGFFMDGEVAQHPVVVGYIPGIPEDDAIPEIGFQDPTPDEELTSELQPRPPDQSPINPDIEAQLDAKNSSTDGEDSSNARPGRFGDPDQLPGGNSAFGVLKKDIKGNPNNPTDYKFDVNVDGSYNQIDADLLSWDVDRNGVLSEKELRDKESGNYDRFVGYFDYASGSSSVKRYPLKTNEPTVSRLARNETIEETIVAIKQGAKTTGANANFSGANFGTMEASIAPPFEEPEVPYNAVYPFNKVYESESGHFIEVDDTPKAERLHWYHRSGTFTEFHPIGIRVDKTVDDQYNLVSKNSYHHSEENTIQNAGTEFRMKAGGIMVCESGASMDFESGGSHNTVVGLDKNILIKGDHWYFNAGEATLYIEEAVKVFIKDKMSLRVEDDLVIDVKGNTAIRGEGDIKIAAEGNLELSAKETLTIESSITTVLGPAYGGDMSVNIAALAGSANLASSLGGVGGVPIPLVSLPAKDPSNDAEEFELDDVVASAIQPGFILDAPKSGDLYKPLSEGDQKLVVLTTTSGPIKLYHAIPTGELETVEIKYLHEDLSITSWTVVRPVHTWEESGLIEEGRSTGTLDGRTVWRFNKAGKDYPKQMMMVGGTQDWLILDSAIRHD